MEIREVTYFAVALRILAAIVFGGLIGLERGLKNRPAGMRTYVLVCVGSCLIMLTNQYIYQCYGTGDPVRMGAQVVSGIGFLGAGTIIVTRQNQIKGLTTAAGLWSAAGVGLALGIGFYEAALAGALAIFTVITLLQRMDRRMHMATRFVDVYFELTNEITLRDFLRALRDQDMTAVNVLRENEASHGDVRAYTATIESKARRNHLVILDEVRNIRGVSYMEEL